MKPVYLSLQGLNSFSERAEIDFTKLTQSGIFGIFGDTGSGKSTILDGINFALYGDVGRSKEKTDIINYKCDSVDVKFTFNVLYGGERRNYTIERSLKRKGSHKAVLYEENQNGESKQIADNATKVKEKVIEIIGVSAEDFRKCIALPQGEFAEFVQSEPRKRLELIERLFNLSKYGEKLKDKLSELWKTTENEYQKTCGEIAAYEDASDEGAKQIENDIAEAKNIYAQLETERESSLKEYNKAESLFKERRNLDDAEKNIEILYKQSDEMEKLRQNLKLLPVCKRITDEDLFKANLEKNIADEKACLVSADEEIKTYQQSVKQTEDELKTFDYERKIAELSKKSADLSAAKGKFTQLDDIHDKLKKVQIEYEKLKKEREEQEKKVASYQARLEALKSEFSKIPELKIENILTDDVKNAIANSAYNDELIFICDLREDIKEYKYDTKLYNFVLGELNKRINYLKEIIYSFSKNKTDVNLHLKEFQSNLELRDNLSERISKGEKLLSDCSSELSILDEKIKQKLDESKEKSQSFQQILSELSEKYGNQPDYEKIQANVSMQQKATNKEYERIKTTLEQQNKKLSSLVEEKKNILKYIEQRSKEVEERQLKIAELLKACGIESVENCKNLLTEFGDFEKASKNLEDYDRRITSYNTIIRQYKNVDGIREITEEKVNAAKKQMDDSEKNLRDKNAEIKVKENDLLVVRQKLVKKKEIIKKLKQITEQRNLVGQLESLIRGNSFMKYVADGHLGEISKVASKMLLDLTDGRYFLVYKKDGFFVGDNYNGGEQRGVNTLSGGETFLVSLSLALALSGVICARSDKDIEFFFLDEGFGTLDETLIEVVMSALEKLKNSNFTIGIISHVEELKHRIESKIIVNKATESHGSTLVLSC